MRFSHLVISGGSLRCLAAVGCVMYHEDQGHLADTRTFVGTSAGAILAMLLAAGYRAREVTDIVTRRLFNNPDLDVEQLMDVAEAYGIDDGRHFIDLFQELLADRLDITREAAAALSFAELERATGRRVVVCVTNVTRRRAEYWGVDNVPAMSVVTAVRASMSIPLLFTPVEWHGCLYVDGGLLDNFPVACVPREARATTLALRVVASVCATRGGEDPNSSLMSYLQAVFDTVHGNANHGGAAPDDAGRLLSIPVEEPGDDTLFCFSFSDMRFVVDAKTTERLVNHGYALARGIDALSTSSESRESAA